MFPVERLVTFAAPAVEMVKLGLKILPTVRPPEHVSPENVPIPDAFTFVPIIAPVVREVDDIAPEETTPVNVPTPPDEIENGVPVVVLVTELTAAPPQVRVEKVPIPDKILKFVPVMELHDKEDAMLVFAPNFPMVTDDAAVPKDNADVVSTELVLTPEMAVINPPAIMVPVTVPGDRVSIEAPLVNRPPVTVRPFVMVPVVDTILGVFRPVPSKVTPLIPM